MSLTTTRGSKSTVRAGYWKGAIAPYGYKRLLLDEKGNPIKILENRERKYQKNHRVKLTVGDPQEIEVVRRIFDCYAYHGMGIKAVVNMLNEEAMPSARGGKWSVSMIHRILGNVTYLGTLVWGKTKEGKFPRLENSWNDTNPSATLHDEDKWIVCEGAHEPIVSKEVFQKVQDVRQRRNCFTPGQLRVATWQPASAIARITRLRQSLATAHASHGRRHHPSSLDHARTAQVSSATLAANHFAQPSSIDGKLPAGSFSQDGGKYP